MRGRVEAASTMLLSLESTDALLLLVLLQHEKLQDDPGREMRLEFWGPIGVLQMCQYVHICVYISI